jgi:hypothetical protein
MVGDDQRTAMRPSDATDGGWQRVPSTAKFFWHCGGCGVDVPYGVSHICMDHISNIKPATGWECPRCHAIHAPWVAACSCPAPTPGYAAGTGG